MCLLLGRISYNTSSFLFSNCGRRCDHLTLQILQNRKAWIRHLRPSLTVRSTTEWHAAVLQLDDSFGRLAGHVVNGILIAQPVRALDGVVHVPLPIVILHVAQSGVDATLSGDGVRSGREQLGDHRSLESLSDQAIGRAKTGAAGSHHHCVVRMVY